MGQPTPLLIMATQAQSDSTTATAGAGRGAGAGAGSAVATTHAPAVRRQGRPLRCSAGHTAITTSSCSAALATAARERTQRHAHKASNRRGKSRSKRGALGPMARVLAQRSVGNSGLGAAAILKSVSLRAGWWLALIKVAMLQLTLAIVLPPPPLYSLTLHAGPSVSVWTRATPGP